MGWHPTVLILFWVMDDDTVFMCVFDGIDTM